MASTRNRQNLNVVGRALVQPKHLPRVRITVSEEEAAGSGRQVFRPQGTHLLKKTLWPGLDVEAMLAGLPPYLVAPVMGRKHVCLVVGPDWNYDISAGQVQPSISEEALRRVRVPGRCRDVPRLRRGGLSLGWTRLSWKPQTHQVRKYRIVCHDTSFHCHALRMNFPSSTSSSCRVRELAHHLQLHPSDLGEGIGIRRNL
mmetsp:Transcript_54359/g.119243  ORF Transcript_54359/g.119243 Transcript_54359/m.119243 type:complete len:200 (-) Transcript_54359:881-1480(-)